MYDVIKQSIMKKIIIVILVLTNYFAFSSKALNVKKDDFQCTESFKVRNIILATLNTPKLQNFLIYHKKINQGNIIILNNPIIQNAVNKEQFEVLYVFYTEKEITDKKIKNFIKFNSITINNQTGRAAFEYKAEGVHGITEFALLKCDWKLISSEITEN